jgi:hypothetical protein
MSDHDDDFDHGNVFAVMLIIATAVFIPAMYGLVNGMFSN